MRFHVLGLGSIGSLLSHHLRRALPTTDSVILIHRTERQAKDALSNGGVIHVENNGLVTTASGFRSETFKATGFEPRAPAKNKRRSKTVVSPIVPILPQHTQVTEVGDDSKSEFIESLFVTTKAHHTLPALHRLVRRISSNTTIVLMQNGMGVYEELINKIFLNPIQRPNFILASNTHGAFRKDTYKVVHAGLGAIEFGIVPSEDGEHDFEAGIFDESIPRSERQLRLGDIMPPSNHPSFERYKSLHNTVTALLLMESLNVSWKPIAQIQTTMRRKLVVNAVINPLTALMGCQNGDIFKTADSRRLMKRICQEASDVFAAQLKVESQSWLDPIAFQDLGTEGVTARRLPRVLTASMLEEEVIRVAQATKANISSMLADVQRGKATEIDFINGYLLKLGSTYRVDMPATATLLNLVKMRTAIPLDQKL